MLSNPNGSTGESTSSAASVTLLHVTSENIHRLIIINEGASGEFSIDNNTWCYFPAGSSASPVCLGFDFRHQSFKSKVLIRRIGSTDLSGVHAIGY